MQGAVRPHAIPQVLSLEHCHESRPLSGVGKRKGVPSPRRMSHLSCSLCSMVDVMSS
jgi:hypothetical protein